MGTATWSEERAEAASFLGVVPPASVAEEIVALQRAAGVEASVLPHVTVKAQPGLSDGNAWRPSVAAAVQRFEPFDLEVGGVRWFGHGIVYLATTGRIDELHRRVLDAVEAVVDEGRFEYEGDDYVPHLTLAAEFAGATRPQLDEVASRFAERRYTFRVESVIEFWRQTRGGTYRPIGEFGLGAGA